MTITSVLEYCLGLKDALCNAPPCQLGGSSTVDEAACRRGYDHACPLFADDIQALIAAGETAFSAANATRCINAYRTFLPQYTAYSCLDPASPTYAQQIYTAAFGTVSCTNGLGTLTPGLFSGGGFTGCEQVFTGTRAPAASCGANEVCTTGTCNDLPDGGGCGTCANDGGTPATPDAGSAAAVGAICSVRGDAGWVTTSDCVGGARCDSTGSGRCLAVVGSATACGGGTNNACDLNCGYHCSNRDGGAGTCIINGANGEHCSVFAGLPCQEGLGCVAATDAGYPDFANGTCSHYAANGAPCSQGTNFDIYPPMVRAGIGSFGYGPDPVCGVGLRCNIPDGGTVGSCGPNGPVATGQPCSTGAFPACRTLGDHCDATHDGGPTTCLAPGAAGANCIRDGDCAFNLFCSNQNICTAFLTEGQDCGGNGRCAGTLTCFHGGCRSLETLTTIGSALCQ